MCQNFAQGERSLLQFQERLAGRRSGGAAFFSCGRHLKGVNRISELSGSFRRSPEPTSKALIIFLNLVLFDVIDCPTEKGGAWKPSGFAMFQDDDAVAIYIVKALKERPSPR